MTERENNMSVCYEREYDVVHRIFSIKGKEISKSVVSRLTGVTPDEPMPKVIRLTKGEMNCKAEVITNIVEAVRGEIPKHKILLDDYLIKRHISDDIKDTSAINKVLTGCVQDYTIMMYYKISETIEHIFVEYIG